LAPRGLPNEAKVTQDVSTSPNRDSPQRRSDRGTATGVSVICPYPLAGPTDESRKKWRWSLLVQMLRSSARWPLPKREHSRDAGSDGTRLAPRGPRVAKLSGVWRPYTGTPGLLSAHGKQQVCYRSGTFGLAGRMNQGALARRGEHSRSLCAQDSCDFTLRCVFPADILNFLRRQTYEALLIRASPIALGTYPQAKTLFVRIDFSEIHGRPIVGTSDIGNHVQLIRVSVLAQHEVSTIDVVVDQTIGLRTGIRELLCKVTFAVREALKTLRANISETSLVPLINE